MCVYARFPISTLVALNKDFVFPITHLTSFPPSIKIKEFFSNFECTAIFPVPLLTAIRVLRKPFYKIFGNVKDLSKYG